MVISLWLMYISDINYRGYNAAVDVPIFNMWEALADEFPEAKVILVVRDDASWEKAVLNHISVF